ncbi:MAG: SpoIIE family protein phosphatase [Lachnospiraceae bacterium]|nr:SpoIIE family protein phosphatase [Lachnospiraceae bacterium]
MTLRKQKSEQEMTKAEQRRHSLAAKTWRSTVISCIVFGLVAQIVAMLFYSASHVKQLISVADGAAHQASQSARRGSDAIGFSKDVMAVYDGLTEEERGLVGTDEYRSLYSELHIEQKGGVYDVLVHMIAGTLSYYDVYDIYIGMYDRQNSRLVYVVDADPDETTRFLPGDWEEVDPKGLDKFMSWNGEGTLYDIELTKAYGLLCTVALPMEDEAGETVAFMLVDISVENVLVGMWEFALQLTIALIFVTILLSWLQVKRISRALVTPINQIAEASANYVEDRRNNQVEKERFAKLNIHSGDELEKLSLALADMERELTDYEANLTKITAEKERIGTELSLATRIQAAMLPHVFPPFPNRKEFNIYAMMNPAREVGGDFYDFFLIDENHLGLVIADVSGKGIPAALFMMISKTILQSCAMLGQGAAETLTKMNDALCSNNQVEMFVTVWLGILEISTGKLTAANAGHEYPAIKRKGGKFELFKDKHGLVIGGMEGMRYREYEIQLNPGDVIYVYTDGVPEASDAEENMFGTARMIEALNKVDSSDVKELVEGVRDGVNAFVKDAEQFDDITMLCLEYRGVTENMAEEKPSKDILTLEATTENLYQVMGFVDERLEAAECMPKAQMQLDLAVEEIFVNVANYAYTPGIGNVTITFELEKASGMAVITFEDSGVPYDPLAKEDPDVTLKAQDREIGGLGVFMVKKNVDDVKYEYRDGKNILTIKKAIR